jgi:hypothetical protein
MMRNLGGAVGIAVCSVILNDRTNLQPPRRERCAYAVGRLVTSVVPSTRMPVHGRMSGPGRHHHPRPRCGSRLGRHVARRLRPNDRSVLRITEIREMTAQGVSISVLKLEGNIHGQWVKELRRVWRASRRSATGTPLRVVLADIGFVDATGKVLLSEMHRDVASDPLTVAIRDDIVAAAARPTRLDRRSRI